VTATATASDNVGVAGVQFRLDDAPLGAEVTAPPYASALNTRGTSDLLVGVVKVIAPGHDHRGQRLDQALSVSCPGATAPIR